MTVDEIIDKMRKQASEDKSTPDEILGQTLNYLADELDKAINEERSRHGSELFEAYCCQPAKKKPTQNHERFSSFDDAVTEFVNSGEAFKYECPPKVVNWNWHLWNYFVIWLFTKYTPKKEVIKAKRDASREDFLSALKDLTEKADAEELTSVADALSKDLDKSGIEFDTENCSGDPEDFDMPGYELGQDTLAGGTFIMWFGAGGDWEQPIAFCVYLGEDDKIHAYVPHEGNCYNKETNAAFGNSLGMSSQEEMESLGVEYKFDMDKMREDASKGLE